MDAPSLPKSRGLRFAEQQMQRHGWSEGKGLGKREDGISEAIKVKVKCDTAGVGHNSAEQFTFHWWDHVFNKTASSISVEPDQDGVKVKKLSEEAAPVSSKKPRKAMLSRDMLYGRFIKSATLTSGGEKPVQESSSSSDASDSSDDEDSKLDLSSAAKLSDETLMKVCGGRTAHKGARHGLTMSAKLSRIEEQERAFMEKYGKKETKQPAEEFNGNDKKRSTKIRQKEGNVGGEEQDDSSEVPKKKKKRRKEELEEDAPNGHEQEHVPSTEEDAATSRKRRSKGSDYIDMAEEAEVLDKDKDTRRAKKKNKKEREELEEDAPNGHGQEHIPSTEEDAATSRRSKASDNIDMAEVLEKDKDTRRAKKKNKRRKEEREELEEDAPNGHEQEHVSSMEEDAATSRKRRSKGSDTAEVLGDQNDHLSVEDDTRQARKKQKRRKEDREEEDSPNSFGQAHVPSMEEDVVTLRRKKKSKVSDNIDMADETEVLDDHKNDTRRAKKKEKRKTEQEESVMSNCYIDNGVHHGHEEHGMTGEEARTSKKKKKKKKKKERRAEDGEESAEVEEQTRNHNQTTADEEHGGERAKRKKKRKDDKDEPEDKVGKKKKSSKSRDRD